MRQTLGEFSVMETRYAPGAQLARHAHADASLSLMLDGEQRERIGQQWRDRAVGTAVIKDPGVEHANAVGPRGAHGLFIEMSSATVAPLVDAAGGQLGWECFDDLGTRHIVRRLGQELRHRLPGAHLIIEGLLFELLGTLVRLKAAGAIDRGSSWVRRATDYLEANYRRRVTIAEVAGAAGVHPSHLAEVFRRRHAVSIGEWVRNRRAEFAREALRDHSRPISGIAFEAGFADQSHLTRVFRIRFGITPAEYRRNGA